MERQRIKYYDVLRILSFLLVILYHMLVQLHLDNICSLESVARYFQNFNMHIATLAVALFFMLSGAGLTLSAEKGLSLKRYFKGRFLRLLIPFYLALLLHYGYTLATTGRLPDVFYAGIPTWRYIFTLLGLDGWLAMHGHPTFSVGIGEWFLGGLIVLTCAFPLLRFCMNRWPKAFFAACTGLYVYIIYNYTSPVEMHMHLLIKGYEFVLGMYFAKYFRAFPVRWQLAAVPVAVFYFTSKTPLNLNYALKITLCAVSVFVAVSALEPVLQKRKLTFLAKAQKYSYPLFLIHHQVIYRMTPRFGPYYTGRRSVALFFALELAAMAALAVALTFASDGVVRLLDGRRRAAQR